MLRSVPLATVLAGLIFVAAAGAQAPDDSGTNVGGSVSSLLRISVSQPTGFTEFPPRSTGRFYDLAITVAVTATDSPVQLSVVDGDAAAGARRGRLVSGGAALSQPLLVAAGKRSFQSLDAPLDPVLMRWDKPLANARATVRVRQRLGAGSGGSRGPYHKLVLLTVSSETP